MSDDYPRVDGSDWISEPEDYQLHLNMKESERHFFEKQMAERIAIMVQDLIQRKVEPGDHPFYPKKRQEETYFKHKGQDGIIDVRTVNPDYAKNLYNWYIKYHDYDENILFMKTLRNKFEEWNYVKNRRFN